MKLRIHRIKLDMNKARTIRRLRNKRGWLHKEIAMRYGISKSHSCNVSKGRFWKE